MCHSTGYRVCWKIAPLMRSSSIYECGNTHMQGHRAFGTTMRACHYMIDMTIIPDKSLPVRQVGRVEGAVAPTACCSCRGALHVAGRPHLPAQPRRAPALCSGLGHGSPRGSEGMSAEASEDAAPEANGGGAAARGGSSSDEELLAARAPTARRKTG